MAVSYTVLYLRFVFQLKLSPLSRDIKKLLVHIPANKFPVFYGN